MRKGSTLAWEIAWRMTAWTVAGGFALGYLYGDLTFALGGVSPNSTNELNDFLTGIFVGAAIGAPIGGGLGMLLGLGLGVVDGWILVAISILRRSIAQRPLSILWHRVAVLIIAGLALLPEVITVIATSPNGVSLSIDLWLLGIGVIAAGWTGWASNRVMKQVGTLALH
jgi:hypothetical protein